MKTKIIHPTIIFTVSMLWLIAITGCTALMALGFEKGVLG